MRKIKKKLKLRHLGILLLTVSAMVILSNVKNVRQSTLGESINNSNKVNSSSNNNGNGHNKDSSNNLNKGEGKKSNDVGGEQLSSPVALPVPSINNQSNILLSEPNSTGSLENSNNTSNVSNSSSNNNNQIIQGVVQVDQTIPQTQKVEVKSKDLKSSVNLNEKGTQVQIQSDNGEVTITAKKADGSVVKLDNNSFIDASSFIFTTSDFPEVEQVTDSLFRLKNGNTTAETTIPLSVNFDKSITALSNEGEKTIELMPDEAIKTLLSKNIISGSSNYSPQLDENGRLISLTQKINLVDMDHKLTYEIQGQREKYILGFIPVSIHKTVMVSEETGKVVSVSENFVEKLKDLISINT